MSSSPNKWNCHDCGYTNPSVWPLCRRCLSENPTIEALSFLNGSGPQFQVGNLHRLPISGLDQNAFKEKANGETGEFGFIVKALT